MLTLIVTLAVGADVDPALLQRVAERTKQVEAFSENCRMTIDVTGEELDSDGKVESSEQSVFRVTKKSGETTSTELLKSIEDGKDVTEEAKKEEAKKAAEGKNRNGKQKKGGTLGELSPFHPSQVRKYRFGILAPPPGNPSLVRVAFQPAGEKDPELLIGDATIDPATGDLLSMSMRLSKTPYLVDSLAMEAELKADTPAGKALSKLSVRGSAGLAFLKKRFRVVTQFSYEPLPP